MTLPKSRIEYWREVFTGRSMDPKERSDLLAICDLALQAGRLRDLIKATHSPKGHAFEAHEMLWDQRCSVCGTLDDQMCSSICSGQAGRDAEDARRLSEALTNAQQGVVLYLADTHKVKSYAHAAVFIELLGERLTAAISAQGSQGGEL